MRCGDILTSPVDSANVPPKLVIKYQEDVRTLIFSRFTREGRSRRRDGARQGKGTATSSQEGPSVCSAASVIVPLDE